MGVQVEGWSNKSEWGNDWGKKDNDWSKDSNDWNKKTDNSWGESKKDDAWGQSNDSKWSKNTTPSSGGNSRGPMDESTANVVKGWETLEKDDDEVHVISWETDAKLEAKQIERWATWEEVKFPKDLRDIMTDGRCASFPHPSLIQQYIWPAITNDNDVIGVAKTGSGKTLGFLMPAFLNIKLLQLKGMVNDCDYGPSCVVLAPTRELVQQIFEESVKFGNPAGIKTAVSYGGDSAAAKRRNQLWYLRRDCPAIVVGTPGRTKDFMDAGDLVVKNVKYSVLDEADRMLDMGFEREIRAILDEFPRERQSMLFSATFPLDVKILARKMLYSDAVHIQIGSSDPLTGNGDILQSVRFVETAKQKMDNMYECFCQYFDKDTHTWKDLGDDAIPVKFLVFCNTKRECDDLSWKFDRWKVPSCSLHGGMDQSARETSLRKLKDGECKCLFATDVCSRGLDIKGITHVINYGMPNQVEDYVHRIGRTGRAGEKGVALTYLLPHELDRVNDIVTSMKKSGQPVPDELAEVARQNPPRRF